ncbi:MAG TPA: cyclic nucleotide-binding domain-containing protein, partial [Rhodocyclaceae bacterium]|nr:cyclic nucleotide-binding domain-containing protein [Rhodocyclaceae bacterium]
LYIIISGEGEVVHELPGGVTQSLALLHAGDVFGEMGLLTGEPRTATVIARSDMECYRLDKSGLQEILQSRPAIAETLSQVLATRLEQNAHADEPSPESAAADRAGLARAMFGKIRAFFNLQ